MALTMEGPVGVSVSVFTASLTGSKSFIGNPVEASTKLTGEVGFPELSV